MKKTFLLLPLLFVGFFLSAQSDADYSKMLVGTWTVESIDLGGQVMTAEMIGSTMEQVFRADGTMTADNPMTGGKDDSNWEVKDGKIANPKKPQEPSAKIISMDDKKMVLEVVDNGMNIKMTFNKKA